MQTQSFLIPCNYTHAQIYDAQDGSLPSKAQTSFLAPRPPFPIFSVCFVSVLRKPTFVQTQQQQNTPKDNVFSPSEPRARTYARSHARTHVTPPLSGTGRKPCVTIRKCFQRLLLIPWRWNVLGEGKQNGGTKLSWGHLIFRGELYPWSGRYVRVLIPQSYVQISGFEMGPLPFFLSQGLLNRKETEIEKFFQWLLNLGLGGKRYPALSWFATMTRHSKSLFGLYIKCWFQSGKNSSLNSKCKISNLFFFL